MTEPKTNVYSAVLEELMQASPSGEVVDLLFKDQDGSTVHLKLSRTAAGTLSQELARLLALEP